MTGFPTRAPESGVPFGLTKHRTTRLELIFVLKSGAHMTVFHETGEPVTEESLAAFARELAAQVASQPEERLFVDDWNASAQRAWVNLAEVAAFSVRPAK